MQNASGADWKAASYVQFARHMYSQKRSMFDVESYAYRGPAIYDGKKYQKLDASTRTSRRSARPSAGGWMAEMQHHFVSAAVPPQGETYDFTLQLEGDHSLVSYRGPLKSVPAGASATFSETLFVGPKLQEQLEDSPARSSSSRSTTASSRSSPTRCSGCSRRCTGSSATGASRSSS